ncbi:MAG: hypothetical protein K0S38_518 [Candidatus Paceibacter sp.]|jgi:uncharacterized protein (DUF305 family)|nr:hypothetical protein [Candidatus Paceibacter sp.]
MTKISLTLASALIIVAGIAGLGIGYAMTPEYKLTMYDKSEMDLGESDRWLDLRYIDAMIAHHRGAVLVAEQIEKNTQRTELKNLSAEIQTNEPKLIAELYQWKKDWYGDTRTVKDPVVPNLGTYDEKFDLRVLNALIAHHEAGLEMTKEVMSKSSRTEILNNANAVDTFLTDTLKVFKDWRKQWYAI